MVMGAAAADLKPRGGSLAKPKLRSQDVALALKPMPPGVVCPSVLAVGRVEGMEG